MWFDQQWAESAKAGRGRGNHLDPTDPEGVCGHGGISVAWQLTVAMTISLNEGLKCWTMVREDKRQERRLEGVNKIKLLGRNGLILVHSPIL